jgi:Tfp pilus assembly protein PilF
VRKTECLRFNKAAAVASLPIIFLTVCCGPAIAGCDMSTTENTWHAGLDVNDDSAYVKSQVRLVEQFHFSADVEMLRAGSTGMLPHDLEYTLNSIPNHYRALAAYSTWELKNPQPARARERSAECWFQRAINFRPDDPQLHTLFGTFLHRAGRLAEAGAEYETAEKMGSNSAELFYNRGLLELDRGNVDVARSYAERAYALGYPLPGLRNKLERYKVPAK